MTSSLTSPAPHLSKADGRYYVTVDGVRVGWVLKAHDGWAFWAKVHDALTGTILASGYATRRDALIEGLSSLRIRHLGAVLILNHETWNDEYAYVDTDLLRRITDGMLDQKYGLDGVPVRRVANAETPA